MREVLPELPDDEIEHVEIVHDEASFHSNDYQNNQYWLKPGEQVLKKKGRGRLIMVSAFLCEHYGLLTLTPEMIAENEKMATELRLTIADSTTVIYPDNKASGDDYWNMKQTIEQPTRSLVPGRANANVNEREDIGLVLLRDLDEDGAAGDGGRLGDGGMDKGEGLELYNSPLFLDHVSLLSRDPISPIPFCFILPFSAGTRLAFCVFGRSEAFAIDVECSVDEYEWRGVRTARESRGSHEEDVEERGVIDCLSTASCIAILNNSAQRSWSMGYLPRTVLRTVQ
ncbi:hypothetical protein B0H14DRAFT_3630315 [Mycena olivaceomarginata]|nr:hypothetical protein B0H14DRAFT_3630315 [Mycena olivaceomarginata]